MVAAIQVELPSKQLPGQLGWCHHIRLWTRKLQVQVFCSNNNFFLNSILPTASAPSCSEEAGCVYPSNNTSLFKWGGDMPSPRHLWSVWCGFLAGGLQMYSRMWISQVLTMCVCVCVSGTMMSSVLWPSRTLSSGTLECWLSSWSGWSWRRAKNWTAVITVWARWATFVQMKSVTLRRGIHQFWRVFPSTRPKWFVWGYLIFLANAKTPPYAELETESLTSAYVS